MKINPIKNLETESIGEIESIEANIAKDSLPFLFDLVTKSFYSDPIGSICREITSNCFDAHKEIDSQEAVIIKKSYSLEDDCYYIHFIDKGIGLSAERIIKIFMNYFSSTKRDSNDLIGGFGIGSKSPLSYQDMFYITTCHNGLKYECILSRGNSKPELDCLYGLETIEEEIEGKLVKVKYPKGIYTDEPNGTEIKIEIKDGDTGKFQGALLSQLSYFDNVYFDNWQIDNDYNIIEGKTFKYRSKNNYSTLMHIVYGKVCYPIDFRKLGIRDVLIPVGVKFEIGELQVTPNRESIIYTDDSKELLKSRITQCIKELVGIYNDQNPKIDNIFTYLERKNEKPHIKFEDDIKLYIPKAYGVENAIVYEKFPTLNIPIDPFFDWDIFRVIGETAERSYTKLATIKSYDINYWSDNKVFSKYTNAYINRSYIAVSHKLSYKEYCTKLGLYYYEPRLYSYQNKYDYINVDDRKVKRVPKLGKAKLIYAYKKHIAELLLKNASNYKDIVVPEEWLKNYKKENRENSAAYKRKLDKKVVGALNFNYRTEHQLSLLSEYKILFYDTSDNTLQHISEILKSRKKSFFRMKDNSGKPINHRLFNKFAFIKIAETNLKLIKDLPNSLHAKDFFTDKRFERVLRDIKTVDEIRGRWYMQYNQILQSLSTYYFNKVNNLYSFIEHNKYNGVRINDEYLNKISINSEIELELKELDIFFKDMEVIKYLQSYTPDKILSEIFRFKKKLKLKSNLYSLNKPMKIKLNVDEFIATEFQNTNPVIIESIDVATLKQNNLNQILI